MAALNDKNMARINKVARVYGAIRLILFGSALDNPSGAIRYRVAC